MNPAKRTAWMTFSTILCLAPLLLLARSNGGPYGRTGFGSEPTCEGSGCHRNEPYGPGAGRVTIDVGPYVPGQKQRIVVTVFDTGARRWGFQLAVRQARNPQQQAGSLSPVPDDLFVAVHCASGGSPPCNNELEYATHTSVGSRLGTPSGFATFRVDWTAPSADVGDVILTAAGMGADGDQGFSGDHTYTTTALSLSVPSNQPVLNEGGVVNAAGFASPNSGISQGALVSLYGVKLAPPSPFSREVTRFDLQDGRLPTELSRIGADFLVPGGSSIPAYVLFVSEKQMNVQVPELPAGFTGQVKVQPVFNRGKGLNEVRGNMVEVAVRTVSPGLFTFADGKSAAAVHAAGTPVGRAAQFPNSQPARPGEVILVFGTGFGATIPPVEPGSLAEGAPRLVAQVTARIGGVSLAPSDILYAGAAPTFAGLQQFNLRIPDAVGSGDLPIILSAGVVDTQPGVTVAVER